jgi:hypothetical protein
MHSLKKAWHKIKERPSLAVFGSITDALFFVSLGLFTTPVSVIMVEQFSKIAQEFSRGLAQEQPELFNVLANSNVTTALFVNITIYFAIIFATYILMQGTSWWIAKKYFHSEKYVKSILVFAKINLFWFALFIVYKLTDFLFNLRFRLLERLQPGTVDIAGNVMIVLFFIGLGAATFGYAKNKTFEYFKTPIKKSSIILLTGALLFFIPYAIFYAIGTINMTVSLWTSAIVLLPLLTYLRIYLMEELNVHSHP